MNAPTPQAGAMLPAVQSPNEVIRMGMDTVQGFEGLQRCAKLLSSSPLVPEIYRGEKGLPSAVIALNLASRIGADILLVMQNLYVVQGRPGWSSKFLIATFNQCGKYTALRYEFVGSEGSDEWGCRAWAIEKATGDRLVGPLVTIGIAKKEGWFGKQGSKWQTMPEQMLRYRAAAWFINTIAPELAMGLPTAEENADVFDVIDAETGEVHTVRAKAPRDVTPRASAAPAGMPTGLGSWTVEQLDELEEMIEKIHAAISAAGFKEEADQFEATTRAKRSKVNPDALLSELRANLAELTAPKAAAPADPSPAAAAPPAAEAKARGGAKKESPAGDGSLFQGGKA